MRDFFYIDEQLLRMYFTQLPGRERAKFKLDVFVNTPDFELGLSPKVKVERYRPELPDEARVALALFMEEHLTKGESPGTLDSLEGKFLQGTVDAFHGTLSFKA